AFQLRRMIKPLLCSCFLPARRSFLGRPKYLLTLVCVGGSILVRAGLALSILQSANAVEPSPPVKPKTGGGGTATPAVSPEKKPVPPGAIDEKLFNGMQWRQIGPF